MLTAADSMWDQIRLDSLIFSPELFLCAGIVIILLGRILLRSSKTHIGEVALFFTLFALFASLLQWVGQYDQLSRTFGRFGASLNPFGLSLLLFCVGLALALLAVVQLRSGWALMGSLVSFFAIATLTACVIELITWGDPSDVCSAFGDSLSNFGHFLRSRVPKQIYGLLLVSDNLTIFVRCFLYGFTALIIGLSILTGIPDSEDSSDFYVLVLGAVLGMALMVASNHLLMIFIAVEMASLPSYALAGFLKGRRLSSEAALKYVVYGGGAAGVMLYGISLLAGKFGTAYLPDLAMGYHASLATLQAGGSPDPVILLGTFFLFIGIAFKLSAVPFHFWCPDVFEGASAEVAGFLSVASKGAALALLARVTYVLGGFDELAPDTGGEPALILARYLVPTLAFFAALTTTFGNLAAYLQTNLKRLLAYSTIAHAGYMMMGLATLSRPGGEAVLFYLIAYLFMNLGAFAVVAFLRNQLGSEELDDYRGLVRRSPWMVITLSLFLLSLLGVPPLVGFMAKFQLFRVLYQEGQGYAALGEPGVAATLYGLLIVGGINTVISAIYYLKVMKVMILEQRIEDVEGGPPQMLREPVLPVVYSCLLALAVFGLGIFWGPLSQASAEGVDRFHRRPAAFERPEEPVGAGADGIPAG
jgi:NADH-quinone oxidoreductase subunit N